MALLEWIEVALAVALAVGSGAIGRRAALVLFRRLRRLARRRSLAIAVVGVIATALSASLSVRHWPTPRIADEFSYQLAADTFASGRLTNPPHPLWRHFETYHIIQQPTYASKYPPAQGLALALGQRIGGHPAVGVWLSFGFAAAALCWMLQAWVPPVWALVGAITCAVNVQLLRFWGDTYWGGAVPMLGGALLFGALGRLRRKPTAVQGFVFGAALTVLANSRPYEGMLTSAVAVVAVLWSLAAARVPIGLALQRVVAPALAVLLLGGVWTAYYNYRVTGDAFRPPYLIHEETYNAVPLFIVQKPKPIPSYRHPQMERGALGWPLGVYRQQLAHPWQSFLAKMWLICRFYLPPLLLLPLIATLPYTASDRRVEFAAVVWLVLLLGIGLEVFCYPHYAAPATCLVAIPVVRAMRLLGTWRRRGGSVGLVYVLALPILGAFAVLVSPFFSPRVSPGSSFWTRARLLETLENTPGRHLVIVHYEPSVDPSNEWVYNRADIDGAKVVWAREMSPNENQELLSYFHDRQAWLAGPATPLKRIPSAAPLDGGVR